MSDQAAHSCADGRRLTVVLGRCHMNRDDAQRIAPGQFVALDEPADWPVEIYVADRFVARGELLTLDGKFCVRVTELIADQALPRAA
jgi:flagellar motor switch protein FliN/FliY